LNLAKKKYKRDPSGKVGAHSAIVEISRYTPTPIESTSLSSSYQSPKGCHPLISKVVGTRDFPHTQRTLYHRATPPPSV